MHLLKRLLGDLADVGGSAALAQVNARLTRLSHQNSSLTISAAKAHLDIQEQLRGHLVRVRGAALLAGLARPPVLLEPLQRRLRLPHRLQQVPRHSLGRMNQSCSQ